MPATLRHPVNAHDGVAFNAIDGRRNTYGRSGGRLAAEFVRMVRRGRQPQRG